MRNVSFFRATKYHNRSCRCSANHTHDSMFEAQYCDTLHLLMKAGEIQAVRTQVSYPLNVNGLHVCNHIVDFLVTNADGKDEVHETKGLATDVWKLKYKLFEALYPDLPYHVITKDSRFDKQAQKLRRKEWNNGKRKKSVKRGVR